MGMGFGGRSLCLSTAEAPEPPFEVAVSVKLDDEAGAAGLVFAADGGDKHYGFYPSAGKLRLTRFDGPDVLTWTILSDEPSPALPAWTLQHAEGAGREGPAALLRER